MKDLTDLWTRYTGQNDPQAREELILHYAYLVKYVVGRLVLRLPPSLQEEDLLGYGILGLMEALGRFDPARGVKFETFALARVRGYILDALRQLDLLPRSARRQAREIETALSELSHTLGRLPTDAEVTTHLNLSLEQYYERLLTANSAVVSLDEPVLHADETINLYDSVEDTSMPTPAMQLDDEEMKQELILAIGALPEREQIMISLYYNDGLTMKEIGQVMGVSESRVSQMHARAVLTLRGLIHSRGEPNPIIYDRKEIDATIYSAAH